MKKKRMSIRVYLLYLCIATFVVNGVAFSKFVTTNSADDAARVAKIGDIDLYETKESDGHTIHTTNNQYMIIPGVDIPKDPKIYYTSGEIACDVKVEFTLPSYWVNDSNNHAKFSIKSQDGSKDLVSFYVNTDVFAYKSANGTKYVYSKTLAPGQAIGTESAPVSVIVDDKVSVSSELNSDEMLYLKQVLQNANATSFELDLQATVIQID